MLSSEDLITAVAVCGEAPFDSSQWHCALDWLARSAGGWAGQLFGSSANGGVQFHASAHIPVEMMLEFEARNGANPKINPRGNIALRKPYEICSDLTFASLAELRVNEFFNDFLYKVDGNHACLARLPSIGETNIWAAVIRSGTQGEPEEADRAAFGAVLPALYTALRVQSMLDGQADKLLAGSFDAASIPALLIASSGRIVALTGAAEELIRYGDVLTLRRGFLSATDPRSEAELQGALHWVIAREAGGPSRPILLHRRELRPIVAEVARTPRGTLDLRFGACGMLLLPRQPTNRLIALDILRRSYDLTVAEAEVALALALGLESVDIAARRNVSVHTVKNQIKFVMQKCRVASRASLARVVISLIGS